MVQDTVALRRRIRQLGPWFQNLNLQGVYTAPDHYLGDYPSAKWRLIQPALPERMNGLTVLDVGCNAGFHALECKRRGADLVLGIDIDSKSLRQARFAASVVGLAIQLKRTSIYSLHRLPMRFDYVFFLGLFYHLRYPLYALDMIVGKVRQKLVFQTMVRGARAEREPLEDYDFNDHSPFNEPGFPGAYFIERRYAGDPTNWWIPNIAAVEGILRSAGLTIDCHPEPETWICSPSARSGKSIWQQELAGTL